MGKDALGDRMKEYEQIEAGRKFLPLLPIYARIDGRTFSNFTKGLDRPYDQRLSNMMIETTKWLVQETNAVVGYTQSDEISLAWLQRSYQEEIFFAGKIQKMVSQLASLATVRFGSLLPWLPELYWKKMPTFDCRAFQLPNLVEASNVFLWREQDATKNSISMAARCCYSHNELHNKNGPEMQEMLWQKGVNWNDYPRHFKRGTFIQRRTLTTPFTAEELEKLPPKHHARTNPSLVVERTEYRELDMPPFGRVVNRPEVIFYGAEPVTEQQEESN